ncbi:MAG TPA: hypothetical protein PKH77_12190 [Anaerolineae bacterium]|nr:hypothetical protein [Anaerolineae bacterium]
MNNFLMPPGIPGELRQQLRTVLSAFEIFRSDARLEAIFIDQRLYPWRNVVPQGGSVDDRVAQLIGFLYDKYDIRGQNALVLFVKVLSEEIHPNDHRRLQLETLARQLESVFLPPMDNPLPVEGVSFPFTNREEEIRQLSSPYAPPYALVDAPAGYGKTELLKRLASEFKARNWLCAYVKVAKFNELSELVHTLADILSVTRYMDTQLPVAQRLGSALNRYWQDLIEMGRTHEGIALLIDFDKRPELKLVSLVVNELIPAIRDSLNLLRVFDGRGFRVVIAGRYLASSPEIQTDKIPLSHPYLLKPFDFKVIRGSVEGYLRNLHPIETLQVAAYAFYLTGGHPGCIAQIVERYLHAGLPLNVFLDVHKEEVAAIIDGAVVGILRELPEKYAYLHDERNIIKRLSIFRYLDSAILEETVCVENVTEVADGYALGDELVHTYLFHRDAGLIRDDIVRRLLAIQWRNERPAEFVTACCYTQEICAHCILESPRQPEQWAVEYLFQSLQHHATSVADANKRSEIARTFFEEVVPGMLQEFIQIKYPESLRDKRDLLLGRLKPTRQFDYDWEFEFTVNYYLRQSHYTDGPYQRLIEQIEEYFRHIHK